MSRHQPVTSSKRLSVTDVVLAAYLVVAAPVILLGALYAAASKLYYVPAGSMWPTFDVGDRFLVRMRTPVCPRLIPAYGDVVVFDDPMGVRSKVLVKRVVGLAGDEVRVTADGLLLNGDAISVPAGEGPDGQALMREAVDGAGSWTVALGATADPMGEAGAWVVPADHVFLLGDNRSRSYDSRRFGSVPIQSVRGRAIRVLWNPSRGPVWRSLQPGRAWFCRAGVAGLPQDWARF